MSLAVPAEGIIPHTGPMLLVQEILEARTGGGGIVRACPSTDWPLACPGGEIAPEACIELAAQAYAALRSLACAPVEPASASGYLVGVQDFVILDRIMLGDDLLVKVLPVGEFAGFSVVEARVCRGDALLARGRIKVWIPQPGEEG